jgi:ferredoxin-thioredoxin reductase catalytic subunit
MISVDDMKRRVQQDAKSRGIRLTPDEKLLQSLLEGLKTNEIRYGYMSCPCRMATGDFETDRDIICPCDYRDPDVAEYGCCYCSLYVDDEIHQGKKQAHAIPERRPYDKQMAAVGLIEKETQEETKGEMKKSNRRLLYCRQCGYVVFSEDPPYVCPICNAKREMFEEIVTVSGHYTRKLE